MRRVMFVCTGNICRSPLAHRVFEHELGQRDLSETFSVESSGTGAWHVGEDADTRMRATAQRHGLSLHHPARKLHRDEARSYDLVFAMARGHMQEIRAIAGQDLASRLYLFRQFDPDLAGPNAALPISVDRAADVPDPYYGGQQGFEDVWNMVQRTCRAVAAELASGRL